MQAFFKELQNEAHILQHIYDELASINHLKNFLKLRNQVNKLRQNPYAHWGETPRRTNSASRGLCPVQTNSTCSTFIAVFY